MPAHVTRSLGHIGEELLHGLTHFDGKAWRTLPALCLRPGQLTYDYVHGKRARYIQPMAMFLFTIFLMFFIFGLLGGLDIDGALNKANAAPDKVATAREAIGDATGDLADAGGSRKRYSRRRYAARGHRSRKSCIG